MSLFCSEVLVLNMKIFMFWRSLFVLFFFWGLYCLSFENHTWNTLLKRFVTRDISYLHKGNWPEKFHHDINMNYISQALGSRILFAFLIKISLGHIDIFQKCSIHVYTRKFWENVNMALNSNKTGQEALKLNIHSR